MIIKEFEILKNRRTAEMYRSFGDEGTEMFDEITFGIHSYQLQDNMFLNSIEPQIIKTDFIHMLHNCFQNIYSKCAGYISRLNIINLCVLEDLVESFLMPCA